MDKRLTKSLDDVTGITPSCSSGTRVISPSARPEQNQLELTLVEIYIKKRTSNIQHAELLDIFGQFYERLDISITNLLNTFIKPSTLTNQLLIHNRNLEKAYNLIKESYEPPNPTTPL